MPIRYKVVSKWTRKSCVVCAGESPIGTYSETLGLIYEQGTVVKARPETLGVFTFRRKKDALVWPFFKSGLANLMILRVRAHGRGKKPKEVIQYTINIRDFLHDVKVGRPWPSSYIKWMEAPEGTLCYPSVEVMD